MGFVVACRCGYDGGSRLVGLAGDLLDVFFVDSVMHANELMRFLFMNCLSVCGMASYVNVFDYYFLDRLTSIQEKVKKVEPYPTKEESIGFDWI